MPVTISLQPFILSEKQGQKPRDLKQWKGFAKANGHMVPSGQVGTLEWKHLESNSYVPSILEIVLYSHQPALVNLVLIAPVRPHH